MSQEEVTQVQVRFVTQQRKYAVIDSAILVPARLKRYGLSEIVNHLLGSGMYSPPGTLTKNPVPFDFLIEGQFLRTSLSEYLENAGLSTENLITIEYVESMLPPTPMSSFQHDDWISSVKGFSQHRYTFITSFYRACQQISNSLSHRVIRQLRSDMEHVRRMRLYLQGPHGTGKGCGVAGS
ncbi:NUC135 domain-containing protein [Jimgerdemannia flammicorona]|uniref:NUC135 domain-containing protein n=1 Tax=Jimgerdemannia flammicorona TaxID=994334 RepID=A0A433DDW4_9FUNG|nr:NUC135 domain-containing protein [Jimgerdemannia flammicorona]